MYTERDIAILTQQRLGWPPTKILALQSLVSAALSNLAQNIASDPRRKDLLLTDSSVVQADFTAGTTYGEPQADLSDVIADYNVLLDYIRYGTVFYSKNTTFTTGDVSTSNDTIVLDGMDGYLITGQQVVFVLDTGGGLNELPTPFVEDTIYYIITTDTTDTFQFATTYANAIAGTEINITTAGDAAANSVETVPQVCQWLKSPNQGALTSNLSIAYPTIWRQGTSMRGNNIQVGGTLQFNVPYQPTVAAFPDDVPLLQDLIDEMVALALAKDPAPRQSKNE